MAPCNRPARVATGATRRKPRTERIARLDLGRGAAAENDREGRRRKQGHRDKKRYRARGSHEGEDEGAGGEAQSNARGVKSEDRAAPVRRSDGVDPILAQNEKNGEADAEDGSEDEPGPIIFGQDHAGEAPFAK